MKFILLIDIYKRDKIQIKVPVKEKIKKAFLLEK